MFFRTNTNTVKYDIWLWVLVTLRWRGIGFNVENYSIKTSFRWSKTEKSLTSKVLDVKGEKMFCLCLGVKIQSTCPGGQCVVPEVLEGEERTKGFG
jgi:hypothetical protein